MLAGRITRHFYKVVLITLLVSLLVTLLAAPQPAIADSHSTQSISVTITVGEDAGYLGYSRGSYGGSDPNSISVSGVHVGLSELKWSAAGREFVVSFSTTIPYPLQTLRVGGSPIDCVHKVGTAQTYICPFDNALWDVAEKHEVTLIFSGIATAVNEVIPHGASDSSKDVTLAAANDNPLGLWSDGTTLWVVDGSDNKVYAYTIASGNRDVHLDFNLHLLNAGHTPRGLSRIDDTFYSMSTVSGGSYAFAYNVNSDDTITYAPPTVYSRFSRHDSLFALPGGRFLSSYSSSNRSYIMVRNTNNTDYTRRIDGNSAAKGIYSDSRYIWLSVGTGALEVYRLDSFLDSSASTISEVVKAPEGLAFRLAASPSYITVNASTMWSIAERGTIATAYHFDPVATDTTKAFAQTPPIITETEFSPAYTIGDTNVVDLTVSWTHTSYTIETADLAITVDYQFDSTFTGKVGTVNVKTFPSTVRIKSIPKENYLLGFRLRYKWANTSAAEIKVKNPLGSKTCTDDDQDDTETTSYNTPGCAFIIGANAFRVSAWSPVHRIQITALLKSVPDPSADIETPKYTGVSDAVADSLIIGGVSPEKAEGLAKTLSIVGWLALSLGVGGVVFFATGATSVSLYLGTLLTFGLWSGLGPFLVGIPWPMALMPAALSLAVMGLLAVKKGGV